MGTPSSEKPRRKYAVCTCGQVSVLPQVRTPTGSSRWSEASWARGSPRAPPGHRPPSTKVLSQLWAVARDPRLGSLDHHVHPPRCLWVRRPAQPASLSSQVSAVAEGPPEAPPGTALPQAQAVGVRTLFLVGHRTVLTRGHLLSPAGRMQVGRGRGSHRVEARRSRDLITEVTPLRHVTCALLTLKTEWLPAGMVARGRLAGAVTEPAHRKAPASQATSSPNSSGKGGAVDA